MASSAVVVPNRIRNAVQALCLTRRESQILELLAMGFSTEAVATTLRISPATIQSHLGHSFVALGVDSRAEAVARVLAKVLDHDQPAVVLFERTAHGLPNSIQAVAHA